MESSTSVHDDLEATVEHQRRFLLLSSHIAKIVVPDDLSVEIAQTTRDRHHFSIYAPAEEIMKFVEGDAIPVQRNIAMDKFFQLWDISTGNVVGDFDTLEEVLSELSDEAKDHGIDAVRDYGLLEFQGEQSSVYAQSEDLANLVAEHMDSLSR